MFGIGSMLARKKVASAPLYNPNVSDVKIASVARDAPPLHTKN